MSPPADECKLTGLLAKPSWCNLWRKCTVADPGCPTVAMIFRRVNGAKLPDAKLPIGMMTADFEKAAENLLHFRKHFASTGYLAFMALLPACKKMTLYGFSGSDTGSVDGHLTDIGHNYSREHELYK